MMTIKKKLGLRLGRLPGAAAAAAAAHLCATAPARADVIVTDAECKANALTAGVSAAVNLGFDVNFGGNTYSQIYVDADGVVRFGGAASDFGSLHGATWATQPQRRKPFIAPFHADVATTGLTRAVTYGPITFGENKRKGFCVSWFGVGPANGGSERNRFQLVIVQRAQPGDFDIVFNYARLEWENGSQPPFVGYFDGRNEVELPGSRQPGVLLDRSSSGLIYGQRAGDEVGRYVLPVVNALLNKAELSGKALGTNGQPLAGAVARTCDTQGLCMTAVTDDKSGIYKLRGFEGADVADLWRVELAPPSGEDILAPRAAFFSFPSVELPIATVADSVFLPPNASCAGLCGGPSAGGCSCEALCELVGDCCPDKLEVCGGTGGSAGAGGAGGGPGSCAADDGTLFCGGQSDDRCFCDDLCAQFGDCCLDRNEVCDAGSGGSGGTGGSGGSGGTGGSGGGGSGGLGGNGGVGGAGGGSSSGSCVADDGTLFCGGQSDDDCFCDGLCIEFGDCCPDKSDVCNSSTGGSAGAGGAAGAAGGGTCKAADGTLFCGDPSPDGCFCDDLCAQFGDCCPDKSEVCDGDTGGSSSCKAADGTLFCGDPSPDGCFCDDLCTQLGDCCPDKNEVCADTGGNAGGGGEAGASSSGAGGAAGASGGAAGAGAGGAAGMSGAGGSGGGAGAPVVSKVVAGGHHSCAIVEGGEVRCWGANGSGQLGAGMATYRQLIPVPVLQAPGGAPLAGVVDLALGDYHSCALLSTGQVRCWGSNSTGQLGIGTNGGELPVAASVVQVPGGLPLAGVKTLALGVSHSCALLNDGEVRCWGANGSGQLGIGTKGGVSAVAVPVVQGPDGALLTGVKTLELGGFHGCALLNDGEVRCWGYNGYGQLGIGTKGGESSVPIPVVRALGGPFLTGVKTIALGGNHSCALLNDGEVRCWGSNWSGQLGTGTNGGELPVAASVVQVPGGLPLAGVKTLALGGDHSCALLNDGEARCWGRGASTTGGGSPVAVVVQEPDGTTLAGVQAVELGGNHSCALLSGGKARCWGWNNYGQLGDGTMADRTTPVLVQFGAGGALGSCFYESGDDESGDYCGIPSYDGCSCDDECELMGDCCSDKFEVCGGTSGSAGSSGNGGSGGAGAGGAAGSGGGAGAGGDEGSGASGAGGMGGFGGVGGEGGTASGGEGSAGVGGAGGAEGTGGIGGASGGGGLGGSGGTGAAGGNGGGVGGEPGASGSCQASDGTLFCGERSPDGCWCDSVCDDFGDCCLDRIEVCGPG